jgi:threonine dehydratase
LAQPSTERLRLPSPGNEAGGGPPVIVDAAAVDAAREGLAGIARRTPLERNPRLSDRLGAEVWLKREDLQSVRSYKLRGAYTFLAGLPAELRGAGVVTASAGNHAQGVAFACRALGITGRIYLPRNTPRQKRDRIAAIGGDAVGTVVAGDTYDDAAALAADDARRSGATLVPAFDHPAVIAGQGTVAAEVIEQLGAAPDVFVVPVGGGGLLAGCAAWLAERAPATRLIGVEPAGAASLAAALAAGRPVPLDRIDAFVDGAAVRQVGTAPLEVILLTTPELVSVAEGAVCTEMLALYQSDGVIAEPAGALAGAALGGSIAIAPGARVVVVVSGGNNDVSRYAEVVERSLIHEGRKHYFLVEFPQEPGALRRFLDEVLGPDDDITLFEYVKRNNREFGPALVGVEIAEAADLPRLLESMADSPIRCERVEPDSPLFRFLV